MLSLESVLGFCHGIVKGGDCKVEFNQPFCWLYSVPNLLIFQHLVTLYLGGFVVRVVNEIECWMLKSVQENRVSQLDLVGDSRLQATRSSTCAKHARSWTVMLAGALQDKIKQLAIRLSRDSVKSRGQAASQPFFEKPDVSHFSLTLVYIPLIPTKERELPERILREKP